MNDPKITVLMPVYNGEKYLCEAIESILSQTFCDFEFLIIDDGSTDRSVEIIKSYSDSRIRLVHNGGNIRLIATLNKGLDLARGKYVARMDCDDVSMPQRLQKQVGLMESSPGIGVCGTWLRTFGDGEGDIWNYPLDHDAIRSRLIFESAIVHASVMMRKESIERYHLFYDDSYLNAEDYELWVRCSKFMRLANIPEVLYLYRMHTRQITKQEKLVSEESALRIRKRQIENLGILPTAEEIDMHLALSTWQFTPTFDFIEQASSWLCKLRSANRVKTCYPEPAFSKVLSAKWFAVCRSAAQLGRRVWKIYWQSSLSQSTDLNLLQKLKFAVKCYL